jgi:hypothetical protein
MLYSKDGTDMAPKPQSKAGVSAKLEAKLQEAMARLLAGTAVRTDGAHTFGNLHTEAGVSRATMNRSRAVIQFRERIEGSDGRSPEMRSKDELIARLGTELKERRAELTEANRRLDAAASVIVALHRENETLRSSKPSPITPLTPSKMKR